MKILDRLKMGKHYKMERFSIIFITLLVLMLTVVGRTYVASIQDRDNILAQQAVLSTQFTTSKTGVGGVVRGVYSSADKKSAFILLGFEDISKISTDAKNYQMFLTGANVKGNDPFITGNITGAIYVFSNRGYMGIYLQHETMFQPQALELTIRANSELVPAKDMSQKEVADASFLTHDQFVVYCNPGGELAIVLDCLSNGSDMPTGYELYYETLIVLEETRIRERLSNHLVDMKSSLDNMHGEYTDRLHSHGLRVPVLPECIKNDQVAKDDNDVLRLVTDEVFATGFNFQWQDGSIQTGYLKDLISLSDNPDMNTIEFFATKNKEVELSGDSQSPVVWTYTNGGLLEDDNIEGVSNPKYDSAKKDVDLYIGARGDYYRVKKIYQTITLRELLVLENVLDIVGDSTSINTDSNVLQIY